jgi:hypothetical protein
MTKWEGKMKRLAKSTTTATLISVTENLFISISSQVHKT